MRKLQFNLNLQYLKEKKADLVPTLFTEHQFQLLEKKLTHKYLSPSEKNEFSRTISRKMKAIYALMGYQEEGILIYGENKMRKDRVDRGMKYLQRFSRKFKNKHVLISGSFLYSKDYNDIDVFVVSKYDKDDFKLGKFHINYLDEEVYHSLFFSSLQMLCLSNRRIRDTIVTEKITLDTFLSLYQELGNDLAGEFKGVDKTLREFLLQAAYIAKRDVPDSAELRHEVKSILRTKKPLELVKKMVVECILLGVEKETFSTIKKLIKSYQEIIQEYPQHENYYKQMIEPLQEVIALAG